MMWLRAKHKHANLVREFRKLNNVFEMRDGHGRTWQLTPAEFEQNYEVINV